MFEFESLELMNLEILLKEYNWKKIKYNDLKLGDYIIINFYPYSQIDLKSRYGTIINIINLKNEKDIEAYTIENIYLENEFNSNFCAAHDWISYFGNSRGYDYEILKRQ